MTTLKGKAAMNEPVINSVIREKGAAMAGQDSSGEPLFNGSLNPREDEYFTYLFNSVPEAIALLDKDGRVFRINEEFERMFGYPASETRGRLIDELVAAPELLAEASSFTERSKKGEIFSAETRRRRRDGTPVEVSLICAPILVQGSQVAVYGIYRDITDRKMAELRLEESRRDLITSNAILTARSRQLEESNAQLERLSNLDGLTGIPNRRFLESFLELETRRAAREGRWLALVMIDVDLFKNYNDRYGHLAGDVCLKSIARALQIVNRPGDLVARYGGEEFVAVLGDCNLETARLIAERMRRNVRDLAIPHEASELAPVVTISLGIAASLPTPEDGPDSVLLEADRALYRAKEAGRDRVRS